MRLKLSERERERERGGGGGAAAEEAEHLARRGLDGRMASVPHDESVLLQNIYRGLGQQDGASTLSPN